jgi:hypothetical protein
MSNFLAIATVTATLRQVLTGSVGVDVPGASVTTARPNGTGAGTPTTGVNVFLYQVTPNGSWRNEDLPTRDGDGNVVERPRAALDLHYLLTFYGADAQLEQQRLLGSVVRTLHERPVLTRQAITGTVAGTPFLAASDLAEDIELVRFTPLPLSLEELSKLWSVFFQTQYTLSIAYQGTVVLIEGADRPRASLPVRARNLYVFPFRQPRIESVADAVSPDGPIVSTSTVRIRGTRLRAETTQVRFGDVLATPAAGNVTDTEITVALPAGLRAGVQGIQVVQPLQLGTPPAEHRGVESNVAPFVLTPRIGKAGPSYQIALANLATAADGTRSADVTVQVDPTVRAGQRVGLLLNQLAVATPAAYSFALAPAAADTPSVTFHVAGVVPGAYLVRIRVDGAESPLDVGVGGYSDPQVTL